MASNVEVKADGNVCCRYVTRPNYTGRTGPDPFLYLSQYLTEMLMRGANWVLVGKPDGKRPLARPRLKSVMFKMILRKSVWRTCRGLNWLRIATSEGLF
jgi:hypothetical protein